MISQLAAYSGKYIPSSQPVGRMFSLGDKLDVIPRIPALEIRNDFLFFIILFSLVLIFSLLTVFKIKIFGKTLEEYLKPIWYFVLVSILVVFWKYVFGLKIEDGLLPLRISQWVWELMIALSAYKLSKIPGFSYPNMFFLGVLYSLIIHGLKVTIRYLFYAKSFMYCLDRFVYGSLIVMAVAFGLGGAILLSKKKK